MAYELSTCISIAGIAYSMYAYINDMCKSIEMRLCELKLENNFSRKLYANHDKILDRITREDNELFSHPLKKDVLLIFDDIKKLQNEHNDLQNIFVRSDAKNDEVIGMSDYHEEIDNDIKILQNKLSFIDTNFIILTSSILNLFYVCCK